MIGTVSQRGKPMRKMLRHWNRLIVVLKLRIIMYNIYIYSIYNYIYIKQLTNFSLLTWVVCSPSSIMNGTATVVPPQGTRGTRNFQPPICKSKTHVYVNYVTIYGFLQRLSNHPNRTAHALVNHHIRWLNHRF